LEAVLERKGPGVLLSLFQLPSWFAGRARDGVGGCDIVACRRGALATAGTPAGRPTVAGGKLGAAGRAAVRAAALVTGAAAGCEAAAAGALTVVGVVVPAAGVAV
jgi:hypothetical protein